MNIQNLDFSFKMDGINRNALLEEAADRIDNLQSHLGPDGSTQGATEEGNLVRELLDNEARLAAFPDVYRITDKDFITNNFKVPARFSQLSKDFKFYWIRFPVGLVTKRNWAFSMIEMRVEFNKNDAAHLRPKAFRIFPDKLFQKLFELNQEIKIGIDENFEFAAESGKIEVDLGGAEGRLDAGVQVNADASLGLAVGPYVFRVKKAAIDHNAPGLEWVFWRLDGVEFFQEDNPELVVVAQVSKETKTFTVEAELQAYRHFNFWASNIRQLIKNLPGGLKAYFQGGMPTEPDKKVWDISKRL